MPILSFILILVLSIYFLVPYLICVILKFALWKYQFTSKPTSFFSIFKYKDVLLKVPIGLNQTLLISINKISFALWPTVLVRIHGLSINFLIKNEFNQWKNHQIELLKMLDDIRTRLKRNG
jgi:hypothetical protein